ncbi:MAG: formate hydrogenlyase subunit 2 [Shewanella sp.]|jgi:formate hydrogenlyase subunit 2|uniref:4Fe-4S dicluster domain-containing protein n=1 Tax=Shewanella TaxID=22 RepID=UPI001673D6F7|nr:4Fe-4S dicluster domain-containing protein [Shewanella fodinae]MBO1271900.1 4Fe-4S dicluster domain-containing protein [Shewanella sp. 4t3-1-2LB]MCL2905824.1 4Fe-4S dicluster domain-containing protein [Shewanella fodinae]MDN5368754.1 formate hydrogenlyase subunit 2 [Shewanella sp.]GGY96730.1 4Fe-4S ferredoxin [Shewanella fodinae]
MNRFVIADPQLCIGCNTCMAACSEAHRLQGLQTEPRLVVMRSAEESAPQMCHQCEDAPCATVCPVNAIRREDEAIVLNESLCIGCKLCAIACPFGAITLSGSKPLDIPLDVCTPLAAPAPRPPRAISPLLDWRPGIRAVAVKCDLCSFRPEGPACIDTCPTSAIVLVSDAELAKASARKRQLASLPNSGSWHAQSATGTVAATDEGQKL